MGYKYSINKNPLPTIYHLLKKKICFCFWKVFKICITSQIRFIWKLQYRNLIKDV